jgi:hypothetical protein
LSSLSPMMRPLTAHPLLRLPGRRPRRRDLLRARPHSGRRNLAGAQRVTVRDGFDTDTAALLADTFLQFSPEWEAVYGGYKPFYRADLQHWFHELDGLPADA